MSGRPGLYQIDPAPFQAAYDSAAANLAAMRKAADRARAALGASLASVTRQQATTKFARTNRERFEELSKDGAVSASERDQANDRGARRRPRSSWWRHRWKRPGGGGISRGGHRSGGSGIEDGPYQSGIHLHHSAHLGRIGRSSVTEGRPGDWRNAGGPGYHSTTGFPCTWTCPNPRPSCCGYGAAWRTAVSVQRQLRKQVRLLLKTTPNIP